MKIWSRALLALALALGACAKKDTSPPPAPILEPLPESTELTHLTLRGTAQYNAKVQVTRTPAASLPGLVADPYTARFQQELPLEVGDNSFTVIATNANGPSQPATFTVKRVAAHAHTLQLSLDDRIVDADTGSVIARARIHNPEAISLAGFEVQFVAAPLVAAPDGGAAPDAGTSAVMVKATTDEAGLAVATLTGLSQSGEWQVTATSALTPPASDTATLVVVGGAPSAIALELSAENVTPGPAITVPAGEDVKARIVVRDATHNVLDVPFVLFTDAPGAQVVADTIHGLNVASATPYRVVASVAATPATGGAVLAVEASVKVVPAPVTTASIAVAPSSLVAGGKVAVTAHLRDALGNIADTSSTTVALKAELCGADPACSSPVADDAAHNPVPANAAVVDGAASTVQVFTAGYERVTATLTDGAASQSASAVVAVSPAATSVISTILSAGQADGGLAPLSGPVAPTTPVHVEVAVTDTYGNPTGAAFSVGTDAPSGRVELPWVAGVTKAGGPYQVTATVAGTALSSTAEFSVQPGPTSSVALSLSAGMVTAGGSVQATATALDAWGNPTGEAVTLTTDAPSGATVSGQDVSFTLAGSFHVTASAGAVSSSPAPVLVVAGPPDDAHFTLALSGGGYSPPSTTHVPSGTALTATVSSADAYGNPVAISYDLVTTYPGFFSANQLTFTAAGTYQVLARIPGTSISRSLTVTIDPGAPATMSLSFPARSVQSGVAIPATVVVRDAAGNLIPNATYQYTVSPSAVTVPATISGDSFTFGTTGAYTVTAKDLLNSAVSASAQLDVTPGVPAAVNLTLTSAGSVTPGGSVSYTVTTTDAAGNVVPDTQAPVNVFTDAPGAIAAGGAVTNLDVAGTYHLIAQVAGTGLTSTKTFTVTPGTAAVVRFALAAFSTAVNFALPYTVSVTDAQGNAIPGAQVSITSSAPSGTVTVDAANLTIAHSQAGTFTVTAQALDGQGAPIAGALDRVALSVLTPADTNPPTNVAITSPSSGVVFTPGRTLTITVTAQDDVALSSIRVQARGSVTNLNCDQVALQPAGTTCVGTSGCAKPAASFSCTIPNNAGLDTVSIVALATDSSGNSTASPIVNATIDPAGLLSAGSGVTAVTVASGNLLDQPAGLVGDAAGNLYVANNGPSANIIKITPAGVQSALTSTFATGLPFDVAYDGTSLYVTLEGRSQLFKFAPGSTPSTLIDTSTCGNRLRMFGLAYNSALFPNLFVADERIPAIANFSTTAPACPSGASIDQWNGVGNWDGVALRGTSVANTIEVFGGEVANSMHVYRRLFNSQNGTWSGTTYTGAPNNSIDDVSGFNQGQCSGPTGSYPSCNPRFLKFGASGKLYASNWDGSAVTSFTVPTVTNGTPASCGANGCVDPTVPVGGLSTPAGLYLPSASPADLYVVDRGRNAIFKLTKNAGTW